ncbi:MAG: hypothetical protein WD066_16440 [Planctomycetaceae bacterium]
MTLLRGSPLKTVCAIVLSATAVAGLRTGLSGEDLSGAYFQTPRGVDSHESAPGITGSVDLAPGFPAPGAPAPGFELPDLDSSDSVVIRGDIGQEWVEQGERIMLLRGRCRIQQGETTMRSRQMVVWQRKSAERRDLPWRIDVYLEDDVEIDRPGRSDIANRRLVTLQAREPATFELGQPAVSEDGANDPVFLRAARLRSGADRSALRPTDLPVPGDGTVGPELRVVPLQRQRSQFRRIQFFPRSAVPLNVVSFEAPHTTPPEQVYIITGGLVVLVEGLEGYDTVDLAADRAVVWTRPENEGEFRSERVQSSDTPFQVYLEGNIVIRQGQNVLRASHAFYDTKSEQALLYNAELKAFVPDLNDTIRVHAERLRQISRDSYHGQRAWASTSKSGRPGYTMESSDIFLEYRWTEPWSRWGAAPRDPFGGAALPESVPWVTGMNNTFRIEDVPLMYFPYFSAPADDPGIPLSRARVGNDSIFGFQVETGWDLFKVLGREQPTGVDSNLLLDYRSERGPGVGIDGKWARLDPFGIPGLGEGEGLAYYQHDTGLDLLGRGRGNLTFPSADRYRVTGGHRQAFPDGLLGIAEIGVFSDLNFYEQYWEREYDTRKDPETLLYFTKSYDNLAWSFLGRPELNDFWNTTQWLRGDGYVLSQPLFDGLLTWSTHTYAGYAGLHPADRPFDPAETFTPLPYVADVDGGVLMTRHMLDAPFHVGPLHFVPYVMGETAYWDQGMAGDSIDRHLFSAGVRSSFMLWRPYPWVRSRVFGLNGLAHKMWFESGYAFTESSRGLDEIAQYNPFDDVSQLHMRERIPTTSFDGTLPDFFDPRSYAVRTGAGRDLAAPYHELVDDQQVLNLAWRHRLQTKAGPPERLRIKDWMILDLEASYFPDAERDNFGDDWGLVGGRYRWNVGDRTSLIAGSRYDFFDGGQELWNLGVLSQRSTRGSLYLGLRQVKGDTLDSQMAIGSYSYQMSPKWVSTFATSYDLATNRNMAQSMTVSRIGADFLFHLGMSYNANKDNFGVSVMLMPRIGPFANATTNLSSLANSLGANR